MKHYLMNFKLGQDQDGNPMLSIRGNIVRKVFIGDTLVFECLPFHDLSVSHTFLVRIHGEIYMAAAGTIEMKRWNAMRWAQAVKRKSLASDIDIRNTTMIGDVQRPKNTQRLSAPARFLLWFFRGVKP